MAFGGVEGLSPPTQLAPELEAWAAQIQSELIKINTTVSTHVHDTTDITTGAFVDARIAESNVTQHEAALTLVAGQIPTLDTAKIGTGTFVDARIAASNVTQHEAALSIAASQVTVGTFSGAFVFDNTLTIAGDVTFEVASQDYLWTADDSRLALQSRSTATTGGFCMFTRDGDGTDSFNFRLYAIGLPGSTANNERLNFKYKASTQIFELMTSSGGTGVARPLHIYTGANSSQIVLNTNGSVSLAGALAVTGASTFSNNITASRANVGGPTLYAFKNSDNTNTTSHNRVQVISGGSSGGDPFIHWLVTSANDFYMGIDNSASDSLIIGSGAEVGTNPAITIATGQAVSIAGTLAVTGDIGLGVAVSSSTFLNIGAATTAKSSIRLAHGTAPTSPIDGDMWTTSASGLFVRINGATVGPLGGSSTGDITRVNITAGIGLLGDQNTATGDHVQTIDFDATSLTALVSGLAAGDHIVVSDGLVSKKALISGIPLSIFQDLPAANLASGTLSGAFTFDTAVNFPAGSQTVPSFRGPSPSGNTGIFFPANDDLAITVNGNTRMTFDHDSTTAGSIVIDRAQIVSAHVDHGTGGTGATTIDFSEGNVHHLENAGSRTMTLNNMRAGGTYLLSIKAVASAVNSWTWSSPGIIWANGTPPVLSVVDGDYDLIHFTVTTGATMGSYTLIHK